MSQPHDVDKFLFDVLSKNNDVALQSNILDSLSFRTKKFRYLISIDDFQDFISKSLETIYKYNASAVIFKEAFDPLKDDRQYEKHFYPLLIDELNLRVKLIIENIFKALRIAYPDDPSKKYAFRTYYYDLISENRVRKDNTTTVLENILPHSLYLDIYNLFVIEDFTNTKKGEDYKKAVQKLYTGFDLNEHKLLDFLEKEDTGWLNLIIVNMRHGKGDTKMLENLDRVNFLKITEVFKEVPGEVLFLLAENAEEKLFHKGDYIIKKGNLIDSIFIIYRGTAKVCVGEEEKGVAELGEKEVLGEIEIFREAAKRIAVASVRAGSDEVVCIRVKKSELDEVFESNTALARALIRSMGDRLERMNERVTELRG